MSFGSLASLMGWIIMSLKCVAAAYLNPCMILICDLVVTLLLRRSVGMSTAAFARAVLEGATQPGVWFPEEVQSSDLQTGLPLVCLMFYSSCP
jgi:hypothetical protein